MNALISVAPSNRGDPVTRAAYAALLAHTRKAPVGEVAQKLFPKDRAALAFVTRDATDLGTSDGWGAPLFGAGVQDFLGTLTPYSVIASLMSKGITASFESSPDMSFPARSTNPAEYGLVTEGGPIPARAASLASVTLTVGKIGGLIAISGTLAKHANGQAVVETLVREDAGRSLDAAYLSTATGGLLHGVTPIIPDVAEGREAMLNDLAAVTSAAAANGSGNVSIIASPSRFAKIRVLAPNFDLPLFASIAVPTNRLVAIDATALVHGFGSNPEIAASNASVVHMDTDPSQIIAAGPTLASPVRSMFQTNGVAVKCMLDIAFGKRTSTCTAYIDDIANW